MMKHFYLQGAMINENIFPINFIVILFLLSVKP